ncbi:MAG: hypothetical protein E3K38_04770 [Candidatus Kuenenia stuttgartiensis]|nr:hypothetical protein [Candidatus Kuenenia stuttgartiensis]
MKAYKNKYNIAYLLLGILIMSICHAAFNYDAYGNDKDSKVGIARHKMSSKATVSSRAASKVSGDDIGNNISASSAPEIELFTGFSSDKVSTEDGSDDPNVVPIVKKKKSNLYVAFKVTGKTKVDIQWKLNGVVVKEEYDFEDPVDGGNLLTNYWYFAWYNAKSNLSVGSLLNDVVIEVKTPDQVWGEGKTALFNFRSY